MLQPTLKTLALLGLVATSAAQVAWGPRLGNRSSGSGLAGAYDAGRDRFVVLSSTLVKGQGTWEFDGRGWIQRRTVVAPDPRHESAMAYDPVRRRILLFGGRRQVVNGAALRDTWEWNGFAWVNRTSSGGPAARWGHILVWDAQRKRAVLHGGTDGTTTFADTWVWNGASWSLLSGAGGPARAHHAAAYSPSYMLTVAFGGVDGRGNVLGETWRFDGAIWRRHQLSVKPSPRFDHGIVADPRRNRLVLIGGAGSVGGDSLGDVWEWDGNWLLRQPFGRVARQAFAAAYDAVGGRVLLHAGFEQANSATILYNDVRAYATLHPAATRTYGNSCVHGMRLSMLQLPWLGQSPAVRIDNPPQNQPGILFGSTSATRWLGQRLPLDLSPLGFTGCQLLVGVDFLSVMPASRAQIIRICNCPLLAGVRLYYQVLYLNPRAPGVAFSDALEMTIGAK